MFIEIKDRHGDAIIINTDCISVITKHPGVMCSKTSDMLKTFRIRLWNGDEYIAVGDYDEIAEILDAHNTP